MKVIVTLGRYLAQTYFWNMVFLLAILLGVIYLFDTVELIRRASKSEAVPLSLVFQMGLLKLPEVGQILFPFAVLFSGIFTFWQLNRRSELVVLRSSGFSVWQFLMPILALVLMIGIFQVSVINPIGALLVSKYEQLENKYLNATDSQIALFQEGLWLRQSTDGQVLEAGDAVDKGYVIINAKKVVPPEWTLNEVSLFYFGQNDTLLLRLDAKTATLQKGLWAFDDVNIHKRNQPTVNQDEILLPTSLTVQDIEESFSSPETLSFWVLPSHIQTLEQTGFNASRLKVHYYSLLAQPLFLIAMILIAATVSMRPPRSGGTLLLVGFGVFAGFFVFFMTSYLQALGSSQQIPPLMAAWAPATICFLLGLTAILNLEDG